MGGAKVMEIKSYDISTQNKEDSGHWSELIEWMKKIGYPADLFGEYVGRYVQEMREMALKTELLMAERKALGMCMKHIQTAFKRASFEI